MNTIAAIATGPGKAGIGVIRVSGPAAAAVIAALTGRPPPPPRHARLDRFRSGAGEILDHGLTLFFPGPNSFTGEDVAEFQGHGGRAVLGGLLEAILAVPGLAAAGPGEFSRRAFLNGRLDLTEAEAIADLVDAETAAQRRQALRQMDGALGQLYEGWRQELLSIQAGIEADIEFPDEDLPPGLPRAAADGMARLVAAISVHLADRRGERLRDGLSVAIIGPPNAGKSSLMNALARRDVAIVSGRAGTTRDVIEVALDLDGWPITLCDTAGLRQAEDEIEDEGIRRARARAEAADLRLLVLDGAAPEEAETLSSWLGPDTIVIGNKSDLAPPPSSWHGAPVMPVSVASGVGLPQMLSALSAAVAERMSDAGLAPTRERHRAALADALDHLRRGFDAPLPEMTAEDVRLAARALGRITGRVDVEDMLDTLFGSFCIGK